MAAGSGKRTSTRLALGEFVIGIRHEAERFRAEGQGRSLEITGEMERELRRINSEAAREAEEIRGDADAEAISIYGEAFGADPEFYAFIRTLETYKALGDNATLMIRSDSDFFRYLEKTDR